MIRNFKKQFPNLKLRSMKNFGFVLILSIAFLCGFIIYCAIFFDAKSGSESILVSAILAAFGFIGKSIWDIFVSNRERHIKFIETQLSDFYYPILIRLKKDSALWEMILYKRKKDTQDAKIGETIEKNVILPNHDEILGIIESKIHLCQNKELSQKFAFYTKHVLIYKSIRETGDINTFPYDFDSRLAWDSEFIPSIEKETERLQFKYNSLQWK